MVSMLSKFYVILYMHWQGKDNEDDQLHVSVIYFFVSVQSRMTAALQCSSLQNLSSILAFFSTK